MTASKDESVSSETNTSEIENISKTEKDEKSNQSLDAATSGKETQSKLSGFAKAFDAHTETLREASLPKTIPNESFATLLRNSKFIDVR